MKSLPSVGSVGDFASSLGVEGLDLLTWCLTTSGFTYCQAVSIDYATVKLCVNIRAVCLVRAIVDVVCVLVLKVLY